MSLEELEALALGDVPAAYRHVGGAAEEQFAELVGGHARDGSLVTTEHVDTLARLERPRAARQIGRRRDEDVLRVGRRRRRRAVVVVVIVVGAGDEDERVDAALVSGEDADALARVEVPAARRAVVRGAEDEVAGADDAVE